MFPITEILDLLAMLKGQKSKSIKAILKDASGILLFIAEQIPENQPLPVNTALSAIPEDDAPLEVYLESMVALHESLSMQASFGQASIKDANRMLAISFNWQGIAKKLIQFVVSQYIPGAGGFLKAQDHAGFSSWRTAWTDEGPKEGELGKNITVKLDFSPFLPYVRQLKDILQPVARKALNDLLDQLFSQTVPVS